ncbi:MAG: hypothetical protein WCC12_15090 [Anaerolineales bacterium]
MEKSEKVSEPERRDWGIILVILLIGFLCVIVAGQWALRFSPSWQLDTDMGSNIDPNRDFLTNRPQGFIEPVDMLILTPPDWMGLFLTPGAEFSTGTPLPPPPPATSTIPGTIAVPATFTPVTASPTNTLVWIPLPPTSTRRPPSDPPTNTPIPDVDLQVSITDRDVSYIPGGIVIYTVVVTNSSAAIVNNVPVLVTLPIEITAANWTCSTTGGATCTPDSGLSVIDTVNLPGGAVVTYTITADIPVVSSTLSASASVTTPAPFTDTNLGNNNAGPESTPALTSELTIGPGNGEWPYLLLGSGNSITMVLSPGIAHSFVYYERYFDPPTNTGIDLDQIVIEISPDGTAWTTVFYWGDSNPGNNGSVAGYCLPLEDDNCRILSTDPSLYNGTGITIDIDSLGLTGTYPWIKLTCPPGDLDGWCDIDAIEP